ncbi:MAG: hypothetical protein ISR65_10645 [Bacteriovoracaceae bacterium]|nr:hypothetical protein [Bacteriovoracaceae bacterium]
MKLLAVLLAVFSLSSCGTARSMYAETKLQVCEDACKIKISKYNYQALSKCKANCRVKFQKDVK